MKKMKGEEDVPLIEAGEIEEEDVSVGEDTPTEEKKEIEHELDESLPIINFLYD